MKRRKNILAVLLAVTVMATAMPGSAIAAPVDGQTTEVSAKAGTEKAEKKEQIRVISITDPKLEKGSFARGTKVKDMKLPDKLSARGYKEKDSKKAEDIKIKDVTWKTDYKEDSTAGKYTFTAQITDDYKLAKDVVLPKLTIEITETQTKTTEKQPETKAAETKQPETKAAEAKKPETKTTEKTPEVKKPETKVTEKETEVRKPETKATEKKPETKISEKQPETKAAEQKQPETKADAKAKDAKSTESEKESETKQSETKESETKQSETKESETKESETENTNLKITAFEVKDAKVTIDEEKQTITVLMQKSDTDLKKLAPKITVPAGVTVDPASEKEVDFSASDKIPVIYKLTRTAEDGKTVTREYKVTAICKHDWKEATCTEAAICKLCGVTGAAALGHDWKEATCTEAAVCKRCGIKGSAALGHDWTKATCKVKSTCKRCKITRGKLAAHTWSKWKVTDEATHEKKGKKERKCGICKKKETKTLPKINLIGEADNNKIEGLTNGGNYATGANITFKAVGDRMDNKAPIEGDVRYLPVSWTCGTGKGDLNETNAYARTLQFTTAGTYTLNVTYERQLYKDGKWIAKGDADVQTVQLNVTGNTIINSTNKGASGSNSNVRVAAVTGDNSPIVLLSIVLAASLAALIALFVSGIRRKNNRK